MSKDILDILRKMKTEREKHRDRLATWKKAGGKLENFPEDETIDDMIKREQRAVKNLEQAIEQLSRMS